MLRALFTSSLAIAAVTSLGSTGAHAGRAAAPEGASRTLIDTYCISCHNEKLRTAGLALDKIDLNRVSVRAETWEKVIRKLRSGAMPPAGAPRPDQAAVHAFRS